MLQRTRIILFVGFTMKASYNTNNTQTDVRVMNMPFSSLSEMIQVTCKIFTRAAAETILLSTATCSTTSLCWDSQEDLSQTKSLLPSKQWRTQLGQLEARKQQLELSLPPPGYMYLRRPLQQFIHLMMEAVYARDLSSYIVARSARSLPTTLAFKWGTDHTTSKECAMSATLPRMRKKPCRQFVVPVEPR